MTGFWIKEQFQHKKQYFLLGALVLLGILFLLIGSDTDSDNAVSVPSTQTAIYQSLPTDGITAMEQKLANTLSQIQGAGNVTVQITVKSGGRKEYALDTQHTSRSTSEESADNSQRTTEVQEQHTVVQQNRGGTQEALLVEETAPEIIGVLVVAEGANDAVVQERLLHAVAALLQISLHQIDIVPGEGAV